VLLPFANEQPSRILLAVPFGVAWMTSGLVLVRDRERRASVPSALAIGE